MPIIQRLAGRELLDSRGRPTVEAVCELASGARATASVPSGASRGSAEARELRDGDPARYAGLGCRAAANNISGDINDTASGRTFTTQGELDTVLCSLDGTAHKGRLGANAILAVSLAFARACAAERGVPFYRHLADMIDTPLSRLPRLTVNLFSGGKHAGGQVPIQDVLLVPLRPGTVDESLAQVYDVYQAAAVLIADKYGMRALTADEGGLAPPCRDSEALIADALEAIGRAGLEPGIDVALAVDVAASQFYHAGTYMLGARHLDSVAMIEQLRDWLERFPLVSIEDGLAEDDWQHWPLLRTTIDGRALTLGDDLLCTDPQRIERAIGAGAADALLLKVNQIGTLSEAAHAYRLARNAGWRVVISARSGETEDDWLADLAVAWSGDYIKIGSITHGERLAKYNRLLAIEAATGLPLAAPAWPAR